VNILIKTKSHGDVKFNVCIGGLISDLKINNHEVGFYFEGIEDIEKLDENRAFFIEIMDRFIELDEIAKKSIVENFNTEYGLDIKCFFRELFRYKKDKELLKIFGSNIFDEIKIEAFVEKIRCVNLIIHCNNNFNISFRYKIPDLKKWHMQSLHVKMNRDYNVYKYTAYL